jgi:hypothetical protein
VDKQRKNAFYPQVFRKKKLVLFVERSTEKTKSALKYNRNKKILDSWGIRQIKVLVNLIQTITKRLMI